MKPRLIIRPAAADDLEEIAVWRGTDSPAASARFLENCPAEFNKLAAMPMLGKARLFNDPRAKNIRSWSVTGFPNY